MPLSYKFLAHQSLITFYNNHFYDLCLQIHFLLPQNAHFAPSCKTLPKIINFIQIQKLFNGSVS